MGRVTGPSPVPDRAAGTSAEHPWPVRLLTSKMSQYIERMSPLWVEGQVVELNRRGTTAYLTLRDPDVDMSLSAAISTHAIAALGTPISPGARVVVHAKPVLWPRRGTLVLDARQIRPVGVGDLLARIEILKQRLAAEGVFDPDRKRPLPLVPRLVGLVTGRDSAAERDVVQTARRRWPRVRFAVRTVAVQGPSTVAEVVAAVAELDADPSIEVVVIARGGGSVEELLPFSNETLLRAVAAATTPVVSAIGHDVDAPLLDLVADRRASTPTDAGRMLVPDAAAERRAVAAAAARGRGVLAARLAQERHTVAVAAARPVLADPAGLLTPHRRQLAELTRRARWVHSTALRHSRDRVLDLAAQLRALSAQSTLERGYAVVELPGGAILTDPAAAGPGTRLRIRVAGGDVAAQALPQDPPEPSG